MNRKKISFAGPWITQKEIDYVADAVRDGWYETYDMHVKRLEQACCDYLDMKHAIATHCCTLALHLSCLALELGPGDEVICTDFSWVATAYAIVYTGATPVFVDITSDTWCIDPVAIRKAITKRTKAIMIVHCFGTPADMPEIMDIACEHGLYVIEDAAPSLGADIGGRKTGTFGDFGCFSFQGAKIAVSGEGGVLLTNNDKLYQRAKLLSSMGRTDSISVFWSDGIGYQYTMGNLTAALALAQVERIDELVAKKREIFSWYEARLNGVPKIKIIREKSGTKSNYCYPSIILERSVKTNRDFIIAELQKLNIHCRPAFPRMSRFPSLPMRFENPIAAAVEKLGISLPSAANLLENDIDFVCNAIISLLR